MSNSVWRVACSRCNYSETVNSQAEAESWVCIHEKRPANKPLAILHHCGFGHKPYWGNRGDQCLECEKEKIKKKAERMLPYWQAEARLTTSKERIPDRFTIYQRALKNQDEERKKERNELAQLISDKISAKLNKIEPEIPELADK